LVFAAKSLNFGAPGRIRTTTPWFVGPLLDVCSSLSKRVQKVAQKSRTASPSSLAYGAPLSGLINAILAALTSRPESAAGARDLRPEIAAGAQALEHKLPSNQYTRRFIACSARRHSI
jgi:hypothetical protein